MDAHTIVAVLDATVLVLLAVAGSFAALALVKAARVRAAEARGSIRAWLLRTRSAGRATANSKPQQISAPISEWVRRASRP